MAQNTKIQWAHHTFNPWRGCTKVSAGCANCYAEKQAKRNPGVLGEWGNGGTRVIASESMWKQPVKWNSEAARLGERHRVFCASMADVFEDRLELEKPRVKLFHLINETTHLDWLLLTKRPENIRRFHGGNGVKRSWAENMPPNVWLGVSVENQEQADKRIPHLLQIPVTVRFLSCEPLLGPVDLRNLVIPRRYGSGLLDCFSLDFKTHHQEVISGPPIGYGPINWVIIGGESGSVARPCNVQWIRNLVGQCREAGVPPFVKQWGSNPIDVGCPAGMQGCEYCAMNDEHGGCEEHRIPQPVHLRDSKGGDMMEWAENLRIREVPHVVSKGEMP